MRPLWIRVPVTVNGTTTLRLARATPVGEGLLRLLGPVPLGEVWNFLPGEYVEYEDQLLPDGSHAIVATRSASRDPEFRLRRRIYGVLGFLAGALVTAYWTAQFGLSHLTAYVLWSLLGGTIFSVLSVRWGDRAWYGLLRPFGWIWWPRY
jgi:hypothetical protein